MSKYPSNLDTNTEVPAVVDNVTEVGSDSMNGLIESVFAIQRALGINPQGSSTDLSSRLAEVLNDDGTLKAAALSAAGLVSLPITNSMIGSTAGIEESKLDLDFTTQSLKNDITSNNVDIAALQNSLANQISRVTRHVLGQAERHLAGQINHSLIDGYIAGAGTTVESALNFIWGSFLAHRSASSDKQHPASVISYAPPTSLGDDEPVITATNVQDALTQTDSAFKEDRRKHNDSAHSNGVSADGYVYLGGQGAVNDASVCLTRYQTAVGGPDIIKVGLCNSATIKSSGFNVGSLNSSTNSLIVSASIGSETRSVTITNIHLTGSNEGVYPSGTGRLSLLGVVDSFNKQFAESRMPVTAFFSRDGELVLQHNIARDDCSITVSNPGSFPAGNELGFSSVLGQESFRQNQYFFNIDGNPFSELRKISDGYVIHAAPSTVVDIGVDVTSSGLDIQDSQLFHIYSHDSNSGESGTYRIIGTAGSTSVILDDTIGSGTFSYIIYDDTLNTDFSGSPRCVDFYLNSNRETLTSVRAEITSSQMSGIASIVSVSQDFNSSSGSTLVLNKSGTTYSLALNVNSETGQTTNFEEGFTGEVRVFSPNNKSYIDVLIVDNLPPSPRTDTITFSSSDAQDDLLFLGSSHVRAGASIVEIPKDLRNIGLSGVSAIGSEFIEKQIESRTSNLHNSGVIRGFDVVSNTSSSVTLNGGCAYIDGLEVVKTRGVIDVTNVASSTGTWNLVLRKNGNLELHQESSGGFTLAESLRTDKFVVLAQILIATGPVIDSVTDSRFFINDIESKISLTVDDRDLGSGSFRSLDSAVLYSREAPNNVKPEITILSDLTISNDLVIDADLNIVALNDLILQGDLTLNSGGSLSVSGDLSVTGNTTLNSNSSLACKSSSTFSSLVEINEGCSLTFEANSTATQFQILGSNVKISGSPKKPTLTFDGVTDGIGISDVVSNIFIEDIDLSIVNSTNDILTINDNTDGVHIKNVGFSQSSTLSSAQLVTSRAGVSSAPGVTVDNFNMTNCDFNNLGAAIYTDTGAWNNIRINNSKFSDLGWAINAQGISNLSIEGCFINNVHTSGMLFTGTCENASVLNNIFSGEFQPSSVPIALQSTGTINRLSVLSNVFEDYTTSGVISVAASNNLDISNNFFVDTTTTSYLISLSSLQYGLFGGNNIYGHTGRVISAANCNVLGNNISSAGSASGSSISLSASSNEVNFSNNIVDITNSLDSADFYNVNMTGNNISVGSISIQGTVSAQPFLCSGNTLSLIDSSATNSIELSSNSNEQSIFANNYVLGQATVSAVFVDDGVFTISDNSIDASSCARALTIGNNSTSASNLYKCTGNQIEAGAAFAIYVDASNSMITNNYTNGAVSGDDILITSSKSNVYVENNFSNTSGAGGNSIRHNDTNPSNVLIANNKNSSSQLVYSCLSGLQSSGSWTPSVTLPTVIELVSSTTADALIVPITNLPIGVELESVSLLADTPGASSTLIIRLFRRQSSTGTSVVEIASASANTAAVYQTISISPTSTEYVSSNNEYLLYISSTAVGNRIGQVVANFKY